VARLQADGIGISWSGRKRCYDNILVERLWRIVKYEEVYLHAYSDGLEAEISLAHFLWRYCHVRPYSSLGGRTPNEVYTEIEPCSSRPEVTMSGARTVQYKAPTSVVPTASRSLRPTRSWCPPTSRRPSPMPLGMRCRYKSLPAAPVQPLASKRIPPLLVQAYARSGRYHACPALTSADLPQRGDPALALAGSGRSSQAPQPQDLYDLPFRHHAGVNCIPVVTCQLRRLDRRDSPVWWQPRAASRFH
jgi:putative transposase